MESKKNKLKNISKSNIIMAIILLVYGISLVFLYYNQAVSTDSGFPSDLPFHINFGLTGVSCYNILYSILALLWKMRGGAYVIAALLSLLTLSSIFASYKLFGYLLPCFNQNNLLVIAIISNMVMPFYITVLNDNHLGLQGSVIYHNSTFIAMKPFAILSLLVFFHLREKYQTKITFKDWIRFATVLLVATVIKPNFLFGFAPAMLIAMIIDFIKGHGESLIRFILLGTTVFPAIIIMAYQYTVLFNNQSKVGLSFATFLKHFAQNSLASPFQSIVFPLIILIFNYKDLFKDKIFSFGWLFGFVNFIIYLFVSEEGIRKYDGNFTWGYSFAVGALFMVCIYKLAQNWILQNKSTKYYILATASLSVHVFCWGIYYLKLLSGGPYW